MLNKNALAYNFCDSKYSKCRKDALLDISSLQNISEVWQSHASLYIIVYFNINEVWNRVYFVYIWFFWHSEKQKRKTNAEENVMLL